MTNPFIADTHNFDSYVDTVDGLLSDISQRWAIYKGYVEQMLGMAQWNQNTDGIIGSTKQAVSNVFGVDVQHEIQKGNDLVSAVDNKINSICKDLSEEMTRADGVHALFTRVDFLRKDISPGLRALAADMAPSFSIHDWTGAARDAFNALTQRQIDTANVTADKMMQFGDWLNEIARANGIYLENVADQLQTFVRTIPAEPSWVNIPPTTDEILSAVSALQLLSKDLDGLGTALDTDRTELNKQFYKAYQDGIGTRDPAGGVLPSTPYDMPSEDAWRAAAPSP